MPARGQEETGRLGVRRKKTGRDKGQDGKMDVRLKLAALKREEHSLKVREHGGGGGREKVEVASGGKGGNGGVIDRNNGDGTVWRARLNRKRTPSIKGGKRRGVNKSAEKKQANNSKKNESEKTNARKRKETRKSAELKKKWS